VGRTLPSAMMVFDGESGRWAKFRRALRREDQVVLDELFTGARLHVASFAYASLAVPMEGVLLAMLISERRRTKALEERVRGMEAEAKVNRGGPGSGTSGGIKAG